MRRCHGVGGAGALAGKKSLLKDARATTRCEPNRAQGSMAELNLLPDKRPKGQASAWGTIARIRNGWRGW